MFGMSGAEIMILLVVGIVVVGPKKLPGMMRTAGRWIAKVRRMTMDVRENTGIDKIIREEGLEKEIREFQSLARSPMLRGLSGLSPSSMVSRALTETAVGSGSSAAFASRAQTSASASSKSSGSSASSSSASPSSASSSGISSLAAPAPSSNAAALIKPAEGNIPRGADQALAMLHASGFFSFREREYPTIGCDSYDALPDDLDDPDAYPFEDPEGEAVASSEPGSSNAAVQAEPAEPESAQPESAQPESAQPESAQPEVPAASADNAKLESEVVKVEAGPIREDKLEASQ